MHTLNKLKLGIHNKGYESTSWYKFCLVSNEDLQSYDGLFIVKEVEDLLHLPNKPLEGIN